jgi:hypothetical protein
LSKRNKGAASGDPTLFWDIGNLETVAKAVHDPGKGTCDPAWPMGLKERYCLS